MIHRPNDEVVDAYFADRTPSQSRLKLLLKGVDTYNSYATDTEAEMMFYTEKQHFIIGQAAETMVQSGSAKFNEVYHTSEMEKPSDTVMSIIQQFFDLQVRLRDPQYPEATFPNIVNEDSTINPDIQEDLLFCIDSHNYYPKWGAAAKINSVIKSGNIYYHELSLAYGKQILSLTEATTINAISDSWKHNSVTSRYFQDLQGVDFFYQLPIYFEIQGVAVKALIDILEVNHSEKFVQVNDLKTLGGYTIEFPNSLRKLRYDFQGNFYTLAVVYWLNTQPDLIGYKIRLPQFIVETTLPGKQGNPLIFEMTNDLMYNAFYGRSVETTTSYIDDRNMENKDIVVSSKFGGVKEAVELYLWHLEHGFEKDRIVVENNGHLKLTWEGIQS